MSLIAGFAQMIIVQRSAASDLLAINLTIDFVPIIIGLVIAALASNLSILKNDRAKAVRFSTLTALGGALDCTPGDLFSVTS